MIHTHARTHTHTHTHTHTQGREARETCHERLSADCSLTVSALAVSLTISCNPTAMMSGSWPAAHCFDCQGFSPAAPTPVANEQGSFSEAPSLISKAVAVTGGALPLPDKGSIGAYCPCAALALAADCACIQFRPSFDVLLLDDVVDELGPGAAVGARAAGFSALLAQTSVSLFPAGLAPPKIQLCQFTMLSATHVHVILVH